MLSKTIKLCLLIEVNNRTFQNIFYTKETQIDNYTLLQVIVCCIKYKKTNTCWLTCDEIPTKPKQIERKTKLNKKFNKCGS